MIEELQSRVLLSASGGSATAMQTLAASAPSAGADVIYVETNNPARGKNAILAERRDNASGQFTQIGVFGTGGTGFYNGGNRIGPDDSDSEIVVSADHRFLFAVNQGSNNVTAFRVGGDGSLSRIGRPVASGGTQPASLTLSGGHLYVANKGNGSGGNKPASYSVLNVAANGSLSRPRRSSVIVRQGISPSQVLASRQGGFIFADNFAPGDGVAEQLQTFQIGADGRLIAPNGFTAGVVGFAPQIQGLVESVNQPLLYAGQVFSGRLAVFSYDASGKPTFVRSVAAEGTAICWLVVSADGKFLYESSTGTDSIEVFSLADPQNPVHLQNLVLADAAVAAGRSHDFQIALDPTGEFLYVVNQAATPSFPAGNALHVFKVSGDGSLAEEAPLVFPSDAVPAASHPQGVVVLHL